MFTRIDKQMRRDLRIRGNLLSDWCTLMRWHDIGIFLILVSFQQINVRVFLQIFYLLAPVARRKCFTRVCHSVGRMAVPYPFPSSGNRPSPFCDQTPLDQMDPSPVRNIGQDSDILPSPLGIRKGNNKHPTGMRSYFCWIYVGYWFDSLSWPSKNTKSNQTELRKVNKNDCFCT